MAARRKTKAKASKAAPKKRLSSKKTAPGKKATAKAAAKKKTSKAKVATKATKKTASKKVVKDASKKKAKKKVAIKTKKKTPKRSPKEQAALRRKRASYRKLLIQKQQNLVQAYMSGKGDSRMHTRDGTEDYIDYAVSSYARDFTLSLTELDRKQLKLVEEALERLRLRRYGHCMHCTQDIPEPRLSVEPWARYCIRCQELEDQGLLQSRFFAEDEEDEVTAAGADDDEDLEEELEKEVDIDGGDDDEESDEDDSIDL